MKYCIDTSTLMDGWIRYYPPDIMPDLWDKFTEMIDKNQLIATEEVFDELTQKEDSLTAWAKDHSAMFYPIDIDTQKAVRVILDQFEGLINVKKEKSMADPFVIALAKVNSATVITGEKPQYPSLSALREVQKVRKPKVKIPDVCNALNIPCIDIVQLFREMGWIFRIQ